MIYKLCIRDSFIGKTRQNRSPVSPVGGSAFPSAVITPKLPFYLNKRKTWRDEFFSRPVDSCIHNAVDIKKYYLHHPVYSTHITGIGQTFCCLATLWPLSSFRFWILNCNLNVFFIWIHYFSSEFTLPSPPRMFAASLTNNSNNKCDPVRTKWKKWPLWLC